MSWFQSACQSSAPVTVKDGSSGKSLQVCGWTSGSVCAGKIILWVYYFIYFTVLHQVTYLFGFLAPGRMGASPECVCMARKAWWNKKNDGNGSQGHRETGGNIWDGGYRQTEGKKPWCWY